jgi:hypothetical protein
MKKKKQKWVVVIRDLRLLVWAVNVAVRRRALRLA